MSDPAPTATMGRAELAGILGFPLSDEQWECVSAPMRPLVIVAGAGTGKTTVMAARVLYLVASGQVAPGEVLGLTFTNRAAGELGERIAALLGRWQARGTVSSDGAIPRGGEGPVRGAGSPGESDPWQDCEPSAVSTYHSFAASLLEEHGLRMGMEPGARLLTGTASAQVAHGVVAQAVELPSWPAEPVAVTSAVMRLDANLAEQAIGTEQLREHDRAVVAELDAAGALTAAAREIRGTARRRLELCDLVDEARRARARAGGIDFTDQMRLCVDLVSGSAELVGQVRARYRLILLDEYQDTSIVQRVILSRLFAGASVTAVGDPLQAIYGWRSASVANIAAFGEHFGTGVTGADLRTLTLNRRSSPVVLEAANRLAAPLRCAHPQVGALVAAGPRPGDVRVSLHEDLAGEIVWLGDTIAQLVDDGEDPGEIAVLGRTNADLVRILAALRARRVPAVISGSAALTATPFAAHLVAMLRMLVDPGDDSAVVAVLSSVRWQVPAADLARLGARARELARAQTPRQPAPTAEEPAVGPAGQQRLRTNPGPDPLARPTLLSAVADPGGGLSLSARQRLRRFHREWRTLCASLDLPLPDLLRRVADTCCLDIEAALASGREVGEDPGLAGLLELAAGFRDAQGRSNAQAFVAYLLAADELGTAETAQTPVRPGAVQLMTVHRSKGLEFPVVVVPHMSAGSFPASRPSPRWTTSPHVVPVELRDDHAVLPALAGFTTADLKQFVADCREHDRSGEDRLAYVAVTRAKRMVIASGHWWGETQRRPRGPSDYLLALRGVATRVDHWAPTPTADQVEARPAHQPRETAWPVSAANPRMTEAAALVRAARLRDPVPPAAVDLTALSSEDRQRYDAVTRRWDLSVTAALSDRDTAATASLPDVLSTTDVMALVRRPAALLESLARPMPRRLSRGADLGTAFHAWVQARWGAEQLVLGDEWVEDWEQAPEAREELAALRAAFELTPYAARVPVALEVPFHLILGGRSLRGRIDAVFPATADAPAGVQWEVVDWKTSATQRADPLQLAIYRLAWSAMHGVAADSVAASFVHIRSGVIERAQDLPDAVQVAELITRRAQEATDPGNQQRRRNGR